MLFSEPEERILDLLLINPYSSNANPMIPLGLASLAAVALEAGYSVEVVDAWAEGLREPAQLAERLRALPVPKVTGVSVLTTNLRGAKDAVTASRAAFPGTLLMIGGPHVSAMPGEVLEQFPAADLGVYGEGELTLKEVLAAFLVDGKAPQGLAGTLWRDGGGKTIQAASRPVIQDLDTLPRPARHLFQLDRYRPHAPYGRRWRYANEITSRGCPFHCAYCSKSVFGDSYRAFSPERVVDDLRELVTRYHVREIHFYDDDLTLNRKRTVDLLERLIAAKLDLIWSCTTRCDLVDAELLSLMKKAGCWMVSYGIESGNEALRATVQKGVSREQIGAAVRDTKRAGMRVTGYFIVGLPGETEETFLETMAFMQALDLDYVNWAVMMVYPGSPFFVNIQNGQYGAGRIISKGEGDQSPFRDSFLLGFEGALTYERMEALSRQASRAFYLRPKIWWRILTDIRSFRQLGAVLDSGWKVFCWLMFKTGKSSK
jgi:anaerobic magnesium-protoporphyrin IX monomethyl ester cyclase